MRKDRIGNWRLDDWPRLSALIKLLLILIWYGGGGFVALFLVAMLLMFTGTLGLKLAQVWGGSWLARAAGYAVTFVLFAGSQIAIGLGVGWIIGLIMERWPNNPISRLVEWVKL